MGMYGSRAVTLLVLISDDVINRILKLDIQTNILVYVTRCCTDLTSKVLKERTFGQSSAVLILVAFENASPYFCTFLANRTEAETLLFQAQLFENIHECQDNLTDSAMYAQSKIDDLRRYLDIANNILEQSWYPKGKHI